jgi:hypothetical protein
VSVKVDVVIVDAFIAVLKVAVTGELIATPAAPLAGAVAVTVGGGLLPPPPDPEPPHPATSRDKLTSHQALGNRMTNFSLPRFGRQIALSDSEPGSAKIPCACIEAAAHG